MVSFPTQELFEDTSIDGSSNVIRFAPSDTTRLNDNITRCMMTPADCLNQLTRMQKARSDLICEEAKGFNLRSINGSSEDFEIAPDPAHVGHDSRVGEYLRGRGSIRMTADARDQLARIMGASKGWNRYASMGNAAPHHFVADFMTMFHRRKSGQEGIVFRTISTPTGDRVVEGVISTEVDRSQSGELLREAILAVINQHGDIIRGIEHTFSASHHSMSLRLLVGDPTAAEFEEDVMKRLYPMVDIRCSDVRKHAPTVTAGAYRPWCANGCLADAFPLGSYTMKNDERIGDFTREVGKIVGNVIPMVAVFGHALEQTRLRRLQPERIFGEDGGARESDLPSGRGILRALRSKRLLGKSHTDRAIDMANNEYDGHINNEWDLMNLLTDAAKGATRIEGRAKAESQILRYALYPGGFSHVANTGFDGDLFKMQIDQMGNRIGELKKQLASSSRMN